MGRIPPDDDDDSYDGSYGSDDDRADLSAFDFFVVDRETGGSDLDAFDPAPEEASDDELPVPLFTVTNPPGTVSVTTYLDGRVRRIDLSPRVTAMTETHLCEEILVIAGLATQDARSAQYTFMLEGMRQQRGRGDDRGDDRDDVATRDFLNRDLDLPTPEQARALRAEVFATRYTDGDALPGRHE